MVKVFQVELSEDRPIYPWYTNVQQAVTSSSSYGYNNVVKDSRPIMVVANDIKEVANAYPKAATIIDIDAKEVVILDSVKIICPVKHHE